MGMGNDVTRVLPFFLKGGPRHRPGTHWEYWNQGYALASEIVARASGKPYTEYCREALFAPAKMAATRFTGDEPPEGFTVAVGQSSHGKPRSALAHPYGNEYGFQYRGMGGAVCSVWDLWRWDRALRFDHPAPLLGAKSRAELFKPGLKECALGWYVAMDKHGRWVQSHGGSVRGFACEVRRYPDHDGCLFVLSNRDDAPVRELTEGVQGILFGDPDELKVAPRPLTGDTLNAIIGEYIDTIKPDGPRLRA